MVRTIRAHYDGKVIVPDEPLNLPTNQRLRVQLLPEWTTAAGTAAERQAAVEWFRGNAIPGLGLPDAALTRESIYGDD
jgi:hypothetical protein